MTQHLKPKRKLAIALLIVGLVSIILGFILWAFYAIRPHWFPTWFNELFWVLAALGFLITVLGSILSDLFLPLWDRFREPASILRLSERTPIRPTNYMTLVERLGRSGKIPWINRNVTSSGLLRKYGRIAVVGWMKSGKTREAAELIRLAQEEGWISVVYEPTSALELINQELLTQEVTAQVDRSQRCLFFIDELDLWPEPERLERLSTCVNGICQIRPDTYFLTTIQRERFSSTVQTWLKTHQFRQIDLPALTISQRLDLARTGAEVLGVEITEGAIIRLANETDGRPYSIVFTLQRAPSTDALNETQTQELLAQSDEEAWAEQRRRIIEIEPMAKPLLDSIVTFLSAGVTPRESSIRRYATYLMTSTSPKVTAHLLNSAAERWSRFDIVAPGGLYSIPEPLVLPLLIDVEEARTQLRIFVERYNPGLWISLAIVIMHPLDAIFRIRGPRLPRYRFLSRLRSKLKFATRHLPSWRVNFELTSRLMTWLAESVFLWSADRALLMSELGSQITRTGYFSSIAFVGKGNHAVNKGDFATALDCFTRAIALDPTNVQAIGERGVTYRRLKQYEEALADFEQAVELDPELARALAHRGLTYREMERYEEALADFEQAIELDLKVAWVLANRGVTYREMKRYEEALADFEQAIELDPKDAWTWIERALTYTKMKRHEDALANLKRAIELDPKSASAMTVQGITYREMKRYEEALADLRRAIELDPKYDWAWAQRGITYREMKRYEEALTDLGRAIELDPKNDLAWAQRGITYREMKRYEEALADLRRAIELDPKYDWAWAQRGITYREMERYEEALADLERAIELDPKAAWVLAYRGVTYREMERYEEALADLERGIDLDPIADWYYYQRAIVYMVMHSHTKSQSDLRQASKSAQETLKKNPNNHTTAFNLALYQLALENTTKAERLYKKTIDHCNNQRILQGAVDDLVDFLTIRPGDDLANCMLTLLQQRLSDLTIKKTIKEIETTSKPINRTMKK